MEHYAKINIACTLRRHFPASVAEAGNSAAWMTGSGESLPVMVRYFKSVSMASTL